MHLRFGIFQRLVFVLLSLLFFFHGNLVEVAAQSQTPHLSTITRGLSDDKLLDLIQRQTLRYFWEYAHPVSGMAAERNTTPDTVTTGGTGFGLMAWIVGVERGWLDRAAVLEKSRKLVDFLAKADRFHGAWPHWLHGATGKVIPFWKLDDGADLVETSYLVQGLLALRAYFDRSDPAEVELRNLITKLWREVEWDFFTRGRNVLYWHWSPRHRWKMNHAIRGWNECLITYLLAASSPTHPISPEVYHQGWATGTVFLHGRDYGRGLVLPLGPKFGGPLFFSHYSFLGIDPRNLKDRYADYWQQVTNHTLLNYRYCLANPLRYKGYGSECWGLTAGDSVNFYAAHSPREDLGVITPTAALSSLPYLPGPVLRAARHFYEVLGDRIWGEMGFVDGFSIHKNWYDTQFLAIDQGPIVVMIENHRTALLWKLFMGIDDVRHGLDRLGFTY